MDPLSPDFFLTPSYTNQSVFKSTRSKSNTTLDVRNTSKGHRYNQDTRSDFERIPDLQITSPKTCISGPIFSHLDFSNSEYSHSNKQTPQNNPLRRREPYLQHLSPSSYYPYSSLIDQINPPNSGQDMNYNITPSHLPMSNPSSTRNKVRCFEEKHLPNKFLHYDVSNKENQGHPNLPKLTPASKVYNLKGKSSQNTSNPSTTRNLSQNARRNSKTSQTLKPSPSPNDLIKTNLSRLINKRHTKAHSFSKEAGGSASSSVKASRDIETLKKRTYNAVSHVNTQREDSKGSLNKTHRHNISERDGRSLLGNIKVIEEQYLGGGFHIDDSSLARRNRVGKNERKPDLNKSKSQNKLNNTSRDKSPVQRFVYGVAPFTANKSETTKVRNNVRPTMSSRTSIERKNNTGSNARPGQQKFYSNRESTSLPHREENAYIMNLEIQTSKETGMNYFKHLFE